MDETCVYEYVYEYGEKSGENGGPTYSYTYSYTRISSRSESDAGRRMRVPRSWLSSSTRQRSGSESRPCSL